MVIPLGKLASEIGAALIGDPDFAIECAAPLDRAQSGALSFLGDPRYRRYLAKTRASAVILGPEFVDECPAAALVSDNVYLSYAKAAALLYPRDRSVAGVHPTAVVDTGCDIDPSASVGPFCVVGFGTRIGARVVIGSGAVIEQDCVIDDDTHIGPRTTLGSGTRIGKRCSIQSGAVIGSDGFGLANDEGAWVGIPQLGRVIIGDDVGVGANTTIDRGALEDTVIEHGVKLGNQIEIAHNVRIGAHTAIVGCNGIAGSTTIGKHCAIGGAVDIADHLRIADNVTVTGRSFVSRSIKEPGTYSSETPLQPTRRWRRNFARFQELDQLAKRVDALEKRLSNKTG